MRWRTTIRRVQDGEAVKLLYESHARDPVDALIDALVTYDLRGHTREDIGEVRIQAVQRSEEIQGVPA